MTLSNTNQYITLSLSNQQSEATTMLAKISVLQSSSKHPPNLVQEVSSKYIY